MTQAVNLKGYKRRNKMFKKYRDDIFRSSVKTIHTLCFFKGRIYISQKITSQEHK